MDQEIKDTVKKYTDIAQGAIGKLHPDFLYLPIYTRLDPSERRTKHLGGCLGKRGFGMSLATKAFKHTYHTLTRGSVLKTYEYSSYDDDPLIGSIYTNDWTHQVAVVVGHEMAHVGQFYIMNRDQRWDEQPHGVLFKNLYGVIRAEINPLLPHQETMKAKYEENIRKIKRIEYS